MPSIITKLGRSSEARCGLLLAVKTDPVFMCMQLFRQLYPQFAQTGEGGAYMQQVCQTFEQAWTELSGSLL
jgi:hypothetical protein